MQPRNLYLLAGRTCKLNRSKYILPYPFAIREGGFRTVPRERVVTKKRASITPVLGCFSYALSFLLN